MKFRLPSQKFFMSAFSLLAALAVLLTFVSTASAEGDKPLSKIPGLGRPTNAVLVRMHSQEGTWFNEQGQMLRQAESLAKDFQSLIDAQAKAGKDTSILDAGLAVFQSEITACWEIHLVAGTTIYNLVAFKANGDVIDRLAAGQSILDGRVQLRDAHQRLTIAMDDLSRSFAKWRHTRIINAGMPSPTPAPTKTPKP